eukprot:TRINITY_DN1746_c0_g1_i1.p1 TRINITY_DN1746_c0_g1~~TRINITY_DN1746_c0_g1_i1.p1  ORF type:complete len:334 (+),score=58.99 TRINITY_DN1746_c0_g1_i1:105-1004(+)
MLDVKRKIENLTNRDTFTMEIEGQFIKEDITLASELGILSGDVIVASVTEAMKSKVWLSLNKVPISISSLTTAIEADNDSTVEHLIHSGLQFPPDEYLTLSIRLRRGYISRLIFSNFQSSCNRSQTSSMLPLHWAAITGNVDMLELMLSNDEDPEYLLSVASNEGLTVLHYSVKKSLNGDVIRSVLSYRPDINALTTKKQSALMLAANTGCSSNISPLLEYEHSPIDLSVADKHGNTALHYVAKLGNPEIMRAVLGYKHLRTDHLQIANKRGLTPKNIAKKRGMEAVLELLLEYEDQSS